MCECVVAASNKLPLPPPGGGLAGDKETGREGVNGSTRLRHLSWGEASPWKRGQGPHDRKQTKTLTDHSRMYGFLQWSEDFINVTFLLYWHSVVTLANHFHTSKKLDNLPASLTENRTGSGLPSGKDVSWSAGFSGETPSGQQCAERSRNSKRPSS